MSQQVVPGWYYIYYGLLYGLLKLLHLPWFSADFLERHKWLLRKKHYLFCVGRLVQKSLVIKVRKPISGLIYYQVSENIYICINPWKSMEILRNIYIFFLFKFLLIKAKSNSFFFFFFLPLLTCFPNLTDQVIKSIVWVYMDI